MKDLSSIETLPIPEGVDIKLKSRVVTVTGPRGTLTKAVKHIQMDIQIVSLRQHLKPPCKRAAARDKHCFSGCKAAGLWDSKGLRRDLKNICPCILRSSLAPGKIIAATRATKLLGCEPRLLACRLDLPLVTDCGHLERRTRLTCRSASIQVKNQQKGNQVVFTVWHGARKHVACLRTVKSMVSNMFTGVTKVSR